MRSETVFCEEGREVVHDGVHTRVILCGKVGSLYAVPGSVHPVGLCSRHVRDYDEAVEIV